MGGDLDRWLFEDSNHYHCFSKERTVDTEDEKHSPFPAVGFEVRQCSLDHSVEPFSINPLHELESPHRSLLKQVQQTMLT